MNNLNDYLITEGILDGLGRYIDTAKMRLDSPALADDLLNFLNNDEYSDIHKFGKAVQRWLDKGSIRHVPLSVKNSLLNIFKNRAGDIKYAADNSIRNQSLLNTTLTPLLNDCFDIFWNMTANKYLLNNEQY